MTEDDEHARLATELCAPIDRVKRMNKHVQKNDLQSVNVLFAREAAGGATERRDVNGQCRE